MQLSRYFFSKTVSHIHIAEKIQSHAADNKANRAMQSVYANCIVKAKATASRCFHVNLEEEWRVQLSENF